MGSKPTAASTEQPIARVAIRVSKVRGKTEDEILSPELQLDSARKYCALHDFHLDEAASAEHQDLDVSGFRRAWRSRPGLMGHLEAAKRGEFSHLIFYKLSRLGRNVRESLDLINAFELAGVTIHVVKEQIDSSQAAGRFMRTVLLAAAEMQSEDTSEFIRDAIIARAKRGKVQHGALPMWVTRCPSCVPNRKIQAGEAEHAAETCGSCHNGYALVPEAVEAVRRMVELRTREGLGYVKLARALNEEGYRTANGKEWTDGNVYKYLSPTWVDTMCGTGYLGREKREGDPDRIVIPNLFPSILTEEEGNVLRVVQERYRRQPMESHIPGAGDWMTNRKKRNGRYSASTQFLLSSLVFCACCGARLSSGCYTEENRAEKHNYFCQRARTRSEAHSQGGVSFGGSSLEDAVLRVVRKVLSEPPPPLEEPKQKKKRARGVEQIDREVDKLLKMNLAGRLSDEDYDRNYDALMKERKAILAAEAEEALPAARDAALGILGNGEEITREQLRQLIKLVVKRVEAPVYLDGVFVREAGTGLRRHARVTLHLPTTEGVDTFLVPIYTNRFKGERAGPFPHPSVCGGS